MPSSPDPHRSERLADVYARAERLRRQRRARLGSGVLVGSLAVFLVGLLVGTNLEVPQQLTSIGRSDVSSTTTTEPPATTTTTRRDLLVEPDPQPDGSGTPPGEEGAVEVPPSGGMAAAPPTTPTTTPTSLSPPTTATSTTLPTCRNSRDPACGPFRYDPVPFNRPMNVEVTFSPAEPAPGDEVTFTVRVRDDGPASPEDCVNQQSYGEDDQSISYCTAMCAAPEPQHGPWDPPPPASTDFEETFRHTYGEAGTYTATFAYNLGEDCTFSPYRSQGEASVTVPVR